MITLHLQSGERTHAGAGLLSCPLQKHAAAVPSKPSSPRLTPGSLSSVPAEGLQVQQSCASPPGGVTVFVTGCGVPKAFPWGFLALFLCPHLEGPVMEEELLLRLARCSSSDRLV